MMVVSFLFLLLIPRRPKRVSSKPLKQKNAHSNKRRSSPARTPMTIPAIAPGLRPLFVVEVIPAALVAPVPEAEGVMKATVVVAEPVDVTVV